MFQVAKFAALVLAASSASALVVPRATHPAGWPTDYLEVMPPTLIIVFTRRQLLDAGLQRLSHSLSCVGLPRQT
jgi:hypothetical protein